MRLVVGGGGTTRDAEVRSRLLCLGGRALSDVELLGLLLDAGAATETARLDGMELLARTGDLVHLGRVLDTVGADMPIRRRVVLQAAFEVGRRAATTPLVAGALMCDAATVFEHFRGRLPQLDRECFFALLVDGRNRLQAEVRVSEGSLTSTLVHPREVFAPAIRSGAAAVVLAHNHPSGDPQPSAEDDALTTRLRQVGELVGIRVLDHIVIGQASFVSMAERGRW